MLLKNQTNGRCESVKVKVHYTLFVILTLISSVSLYSQNKSIVIARPGSGSISGPYGSVVTYAQSGTRAFTFGGTPSNNVFGDGFGFAMGDVNGDNVEEIVIARPGSGSISGPDGSVKIYHQIGITIASFSGPANTVFGDGFGLAMGDVNGDNVDEIVIARPGSGSIPGPSGSVKIYNQLGAVIASFGGPANDVFGDGFGLAVGGEASDRDGDGLLDYWEEIGFNLDADTDIEFDLPALGADPDHKNIFVEIDFFDCNIAGGDCPPGDPHSHRPFAGAINTVVNSFADTPIVGNPDGVNGINLIVQIDEALPHQMNCDFGGSCFGGNKARNFGTLAERASPSSTNILIAKRLVFHYNLWVHDLAPEGASTGVGELFGNDFLVSLGSWTGQVGTFNDQAGTFMHELGHNLGLDHGGGDGVNCKPNYLSVMSYAFQVTGLQPGVIFDYSRDILPGTGILNESNLDETIGIQDGVLNTVYGPPVNFDGVDRGGDGDLTDDWLIGSGIGTIDWNNNGNPTEVNARADINNLEIPDCEPSPNQILRGYNDWANLRYAFRNSPNQADGVHETPSAQELNYETAQRIKERARAVTDWQFEYSAKILCGIQKDQKNMRLARGFYATTINIHNPNSHDVQFSKTLSLTFPPEKQRAGEIKPISIDRLRPNEALKVDCVDIADKLFPNGFPTPYIEGFVVIQSRFSLDVTAVYTTASLDKKGRVSSHSSIDVEQIKERKLERGISSKELPDLVPMPVPNCSNDSSCFCDIRGDTLFVAIRNEGNALAGESITEVDFGSLGKLTSKTKALNPGEQIRMLFLIPVGCRNADCEIKITADKNVEITEMDEANNIAANKCPRKKIMGR